MSNNSNVCAYCRRPGKLTREHLYPRFLYERVGPRCLGYNESADKVTRGERLIKDVCATCNNQLLGKLDAYGRQYFQVNKVAQTFTDRIDVEIQYDYDLLLRWVLKISYNSFRTLGYPKNPFASLISYILSGQPRPKAKFLRLYLELVRDHKLTERERPLVAEEFRQTGYVPCQMLASGRVTNGPSDLGCHCRHFQVNAHRFTLFIFPYRTKASDADSFIRTFRAQFEFAKRVEPSSNSLKLRVSKRDVFEIHAGAQVHPRERMLETQYAIHTNMVESK